MIQNIEQITDKCQKCGKEFEIGEIGDSVNGLLVCLNCAKQPVKKVKEIVKPKENLKDDKPKKISKKKSIF